MDIPRSLATAAREVKLCVRVAIHYSLAGDCQKCICTASIIIVNGLAIASRAAAARWDVIAN